MRKFFLLLTVVLLLVSPGLARAQAELAFEEFIIQVWPEYDQPSALVIYDFKLAAGTPLPATVQIRVPKDGSIFAVAQDTTQGLMTVTYEAPVVVDDYEVLTLTLTDFSLYRVEFYAPLQKNGSLRQYALTWPGDYAVGTLTVLVQKPIGARNLTTTPALVEAMPARDGFIYAQGAFSSLPAGQPFELLVQYEKDNDTLSIASQTPSPAGTLEQAQGGTMPISSLLPWLAGGMGIALIVGGLLWYWRSGRRSEDRPRGAGRKRHAVTTSADEPAGRIYCSQCGKRAEGNDRFCRACGARLRRD